MKEIALSYLQKDHLSNAGMIEVINRNTAQIKVASDKGVLLKDIVSDVYMLSFDETKDAITAIQKESNVKIVQSTDSLFFQWVKQNMKLKYGMECFQVVYDSKSKRILSNRLCIRKLRKEEEYIVQNNYKKLSKEELHEICNRGNLYVGILDGQMIGFIGNHLEGSIGLLEVFFEYRRQGFAQDLQGIYDK